MQCNPWDLIGSYNEDEVAQAYEEFRAQFRAPQLSYFSMPITTGQRLFDLIQEDPKALHRPDWLRIRKERLIIPNTEEFSAMAQEIAERWGMEEHIDPSTIYYENWSQNDYNAFWRLVMESMTREVIFCPGWHLSQGAAMEFLNAQELGIPTYTHEMVPIDIKEGINMIRESILEYARVDQDTTYMENIVAELRKLRGHFKDEGLEELASGGNNVAQFVSFAPDGSIRFARLQGDPDISGLHRMEILSLLLEKSPAGTVNVRSFDPHSPKGDPLAYGLSTVDAVNAEISGRLFDGKHVIVNETIDINDGGVSGVSLGNLVEFAPHDTPKCVEKEGTCSLTRQSARHILGTIYGIPMDRIASPRGIPWTWGTELRVEFSTHLAPCGYLGERYLIWEVEEIPEEKVTPAVDEITQWSNRFSRMLGDKAFGMLFASALAAGLNIPQTTVVSKEVPPFTFGRNVPGGKLWTRTCPVVRTPGKFPTEPRFTDPFAMMAECDREEPGSVASIIFCHGVPAKWSGSAIWQGEEIVIEGASGEGEDFMSGAALESLPGDVITLVQREMEKIAQHVGPCDIEWVIDQGDEVWVVQMHRPKGVAKRQELQEPLEYDPRDGLDALRELVTRAGDRGIRVTRPVGVTSHVGDILRESGVPWEIA